MNTESSIRIDAPAAVVWAVFSDVERWSDWTASIEHVVALDGGDLAVGRRFAIKQPRLPSLVWEVTDLVPGASWIWRQRSPGATAVAVHEVIADGRARTLVRQSFAQHGPIGTLIGRLFAGTTRRYLEMEAAGLKAASEARAGRDATSA